MTDCPKPGIYHGVPFDDYLGWGAVNNSSLTAAERSMLHFRTQDRTAATSAMAFGSLCHAGRLEPEALAERYAVMPDFAAQVRRPDGTKYANPKATGQYKEMVAEWEAAHVGREIVTHNEYQRMLGVLVALANHPRAAAWLTAGASEVSIVWQDADTGVLCKARLDRWDTQAGSITDLKTCRDASDFERAVANFRYHRQAAFYCDGMDVLTGKRHPFNIVVVEAEPPHGVRAAPISGSALASGRRLYKRLLRQIAECERTGEWPGYDDPHEWELPAWAAEDLELTISGQPVEV